MLLITRCSTLNNSRSEYTRLISSSNTLTHLCLQSHNDSISSHLLASEEIREVTVSRMIDRLIQLMFHVMTKDPWEASRISDSSRQTTVTSYCNALNVFQFDMSTDGSTFSGRRWPHVVASWQEFAVLSLPPLSWHLSFWHCLARMAPTPCSTGIRWRWVVSCKNFILILY